jgi:hypothetical protein
MRSPGTLLPQGLGRREQPALEPDTVRKLRLDVALELLHCALERPGVATDEAGGERRALPERVVIGLGDRRAKATLKLRLERQQLLALPLERSVLGEVQMNLNDGEIAQL